MPSSPRANPSHSPLGQGTKTRPTAAAALGSTWGLYPAMHLCDPNRSRRPRLARWGGGDAIARDESTGTLLIPRLRRPRMSPQDRCSFLKTTTLSAAALALPHLIEPSHARGAGGLGFVTTNDGYKLRYEEAGSGKPLVCIPGWSQTAAQFKHQLTGLNDRYRVISGREGGEWRPLRSELALHERQCPCRTRRSEDDGGLHRGDVHPRLPQGRGGVGHQAESEAAPGVRGEVAVRPRHARLAPHHPPDQHSDSRCGRQDQSRALEVAGLDREPDPRVQAGDLRGERGREPLHVYGEPSEVQQDRSGLHGLTRCWRASPLHRATSASDREPLRVVNELPPGTVEDARFRRRS